MDWFVSNVKAVVVRNLNPAEGVLDVLPSSRMEMVDKVDGTVLLKSAVYKNSCNPMWNVAGEVKPHAKDAVQFRVIDSVEDSWENVFDVNLSGNLMVLCAVTFEQLDWLPLNTLIFVTERDLIVTEELYSVLMDSGDKFKKVMGIKVDLEDRPNMDQEQVSTVLKQAMVRDEALEKLEKLRSSLSENLQILSTDVAPESVLRRVAAAEEQAHLSALRAQVQELQVAVAREEELETKARSKVAAVTKKLQAGLKQCAELKRDTGVTRKAKARITNETLKFEFLLETRRLRLLWDLEAIYPIDECSKGLYMIAGIPLPRDLTHALQTQGDDKVATALGATAHMVLLTAKYFDLSLRYLVTVQGSRSYLRDPAATSAASAVRPLFKTLNTNSRVAVEKLESAVVWLRRDIEQILITVGSTYDSSMCVLGNLFIFFKRQLQPTDMGDLAI